VADEVRNLAMRAAEAAKNTANLIEGTVKKVQDGSDLVAATSDAFTEVVTYTGKVGGLVGELAAASQEQAQGIDQINKAVAEMDKVVQQNASSSEETAAASEQLSAQAEQMKAFVVDLAAVVRGNNNSSMETFSTDDYQTRKSAKVAIGQKLKAGVQKVLAAPATKIREVHPHNPAKQVRPDQLIPMGEGNFKSF